MGQIVKRKKKGRPPKTDPASRDPPAAERDLRRSLRRRNVKYVFDLDDYFDEDELFEDDEDQRRREKKLKLLLKLQGDGGGGEAEGNGEQLPESTPGQHSRRVKHAPVASPSSPSEDADKPSKKRRIGGGIEDDVDEENDDVIGEEEEEEEDNYNNNNNNYNEEAEAEDEEVKERKVETKAAEDSPPGSPEEAAPCGIPLPEKKTLELILDKLQKKDLYNVYAEPVDPEELPDYHDVIKNPMDFATVRKKLANGSYTTLEEFESDVFLICTNAMQYNARDTIYHKQARTIQELAKRKFHKIRVKFERSEKEIKPELKQRSGSTPMKPIRRSVSRNMQEPVGSDFSSGATLATTIDLQNISHALQAVGYEKPGGVNGIIEANSHLPDNNLDKGDESLQGKGLRFTRKSFIQDDNRRATYSISLSQPVSCSESIFSTFEEESKQLIPVGLYSEHSYARSLARFAATLGSVAWSVASKRIEQALPQGYKYGRGWVGEYEPLPTPVLVLENCNVKEPPFFCKVVKPVAVPMKIARIPMTTDSPRDGPGDAFFLDKSLAFLSPAGIRPPSAPVTAASPSSRETQRPPSAPVAAASPPLREQHRPPSAPFSAASFPLREQHRPPSAPVAATSPPSREQHRPPSAPVATASLPFREQHIRGDVSEVKPAFFLSPGIRPSGSANLNYQQQSSQSETRESDKKVSKQVELNTPASVNKHGPDPITPRQRPTKNSEMEPPRSMEFAFRNVNNFPPSGSLKLPDSGNAGAKGGLPNGKVAPNRSDGNAISSSSSNLGKTTNYYPHEQGQGPLSDPVQLMRMLTEKAQNEQKTSNQPFYSAPQGLPSSPSVSNDPNNAAAAAARAWMSVGAGGFRPVVENSNLHKNQIYADSLYNPTRSQPQVSRFGGESLASASGIPPQTDRNASQVHTFVPQGPIPMHFQNQQQMVFPQFVTADLSRFQMQPTWRNASPPMHSRHKQDSLPPDLNIGFQSSGSPGRPASGVLVDSQQPDLALQL